MAKTYTITASSMNAGRTSSLATNWTGFQQGGAAGLVTGYSSAGYSSSFYRAVNILFSSSDLAQFSGKTITSIVLRITVSSGTLGSSSYPYRVRYKYDNQTSTASSGYAWASGTAAGGTLSNTDVATWSNGQSSGTTTITANSTHDFSVGTTLPAYGYVIAGSTGIAYMTLASNATLIITTNETDYTLKLSYNANGGSGAPSAQSATVTTSGTPSYTFTISSTRPTRTGYNFLGWSTSSTATSASYQPSGSITISANTTLYAVWQQITYTVSYNKGSSGTGTNTSATKTYGEALTLKGAIFTRTGYTQTGWSTSDGGSMAYGLSASYTANAAVTLYPYWTINTYAVTYNKGSNGTGTNTSDTKTYGTALTLKGAIFTRTGYTQTGWSTSDGGSKTYNLSASYTTNAAVTLYPFWTINTYTVSYNKGANGTGTNTTATKTYGTALTLLGATFTRTGYYQSGWATTDGDALAYALSGSYTSNSAVTLYPVWTAYTVTIQYKANGAELASSHGDGFAIDSDGFITRNGSRNFHSVAYGSSTDLWNYNNSSGINIIRTGYHIVSGAEWNTDASGTGESFNQGTDYTATDFDSSVTTGNRTIVLYANWVIDTYTISYNANGGSGAPSSQSKTYNVNLTLSATIPTNGVMQFLGWAETDYAVEAQYQPSGTFTKNQNTVLYAVWGVSNTTVRVMGSDGSLHQYPIYYMSNNGLVSASVYYMGSDGVLHPQQ